MNVKKTSRKYALPACFLRELLFKKVNPGQAGRRLRNRPQKMCSFAIGMMANKLTVTGVILATLLAACGAVTTEQGLMKRGLAGMETKEYSRALEDFSMVLQLNERQDAAYFNRGVALLELNRFQEALADFNKAIEINPSNPDAYYRRSCARVALNDFLGAMSDVNLALKTNPKDDRYYFLRSKAKQGLQDYRGAAEDLSQASKLNPANPAYLMDRVAAFVRVNDFNNAILCLDKVIQLAPGDFSAYNARAILKMQSGDKEGACRDWSRAGELGDAKAYDKIRDNCNN